MHIGDGFLPTPVWVAGYGAAGALTLVSLPALVRTSAPRVAMITSAFFVASLLSFPLGPTSVHLVLVGLSGVVLGRAAFVSVLVGVALQLLMFRFGAWTTLGLNAFNMGAGALCAGAVFHGLPRPRRAWLRGALAGFLGTLTALLCFAAAMLSAGEGLRAVAWASIGFHAPVLIVEALVTAQAVAFLERVRPELLGPGARAEAPGQPVPS